MKPSKKMAHIEQDHVCLSLVLNKLNFKDSIKGTFVTE